MRVAAWADAGGASGRDLRVVAVSLGIFTVCLFASHGLAFDGSVQTVAPKISPKGFTSPEQALRAGIDDLKAGDAASSVEALTYAAEGGQPIARWKLGEMYADGIGVAQDKVKAYQHFNKLVEDYDEDAPDQRNLGAISNAFVAVGVYCLTGIPNGNLPADPVRARSLFQYAAATFGDPDAQYNLAHMYITGSGGLAKDNLVALRWLMLAAGKGHRPSQALLGHMLFIGDGVPPQRARGLMWMSIAKDGALGPKDEWIQNFYQNDYAAASDEDRKSAAAMFDKHSKGPPLPSFISRSIITTLQMLRPLGVPMLAGAATPAPSE
jgi:uncharacterized protein